MAIEKEYNKWADEHDNKTAQYDVESRELFYSFLDFETENKKLLDIACASGHDLQYYQDTLGCNVYGVDSSDEEIEIAKQRISSDKLFVSTADNLPFEDESFDIVVSKYAAQAFPDILKFYKDAQRVLKKNGYFVLLATHPMRHFLEKENKPRDYFSKEVVTSWIYDHTIPLSEYSHTLNDYLSDYFLSNFQLLSFLESKETPGAIDFIDNEIYPGYFIIKAKKI